MFQTQINQFLARGIEGEYADDSPHREQSYVLLANNAEGIAATGSLAFAANPANGDTITIGAVVYKFATTLTQANDIKIGADISATLDSLEKTINGEGEPDTDYAAGTTTPLVNVTASVSGSTVTLNATDAGVAGNALALASSAANVTVTAFSGGTDEIVRLPQFAHAFTMGTDEGTAQLGGEGVFAGVLVNPKMYANYMNLQPSMKLPNGSQGGLCTFGHIFVTPATDYAVGNVAAYDKVTGKISAYVNAEAVPANAVLIQHSQFIKYSGKAGTPAILQLGD